MNYRCPQCQSTKIIPMASASSGARPQVPKSLLVLVPSILLLLFLVLFSIVVLVLGNQPHTILQVATLLAFLSCVGSAFMFWRVLPDFKVTMQNFMRAQKHWKCRDCQHEWHQS